MFRKKSLLALLLSLCMVVGILPATAFAAGLYVPENPRWSGYGNQVMWNKPANASGSTYLEYQAQLVLNGQVLQTKSVEIDRWVFFDSKNITQSKDAYTLKVRARQIYLTGDPDGSYTVWKRDDWGDWAIGGNTGGGEGPTPPHEHSFGGWKNNGTQHWKECSCGEKSEESPHNFGDWTETKPATTTEEGLKERTCSVCEYTQEETIPVHTHDVHDKAWKYDDTNHWKECSCGEKLNVANHAYGEWRVTKPATTTEEGSRERTCSVCEYTQKETIPVHVHSIHDETWKYDDTNHWKECSCGEKLNVANHAYGEWRVTKPATETEEGSKARDCTVCDHVQTETIPMLEHEHGIHDETWKYDKTQHWQECSCGEKLNVANHAYGEWSVTKPATETEEGSKARDCTVCDHVQTETIPMLEHEHGIHDETWKYDKTQHWQECSCGEKLNVANHTYGDWKVTKEATETEAGSRERGCTVCEYVQVEIIPEIGHEHGIHDETWKYDKTQHWQECSCGEKLNVANHIYGDWKVTKEATETEVGSRERGCTVCEYVQVEIIPEIGHEHGIHDETWKYDETDHWQECSCGEKLNVANHTYGDWKVTKEATETEAGSRERGCAVCEYVQTEAIPAAGTGEPTDSTDPTDSSDSQGQQDPSGDTGSPQTGDGSDMALWIGLMMASCGGVLGMLFYRRKKAAAGK
nr:LPXTG cell wall anchor domain-containing protein [Massilistercora timonensis]